MSFDKCLCMEPPPQPRYRPSLHHPRTFCHAPCSHTAPPSPDNPPSALHPYSLLLALPESYQSRAVGRALSLPSSLCALRRLRDSSSRPVAVGGLSFSVVLGYGCTTVCPCAWGWIFGCFPVRGWYESRCCECACTRRVWISRFRFSGADAWERDHWAVWRAHSSLAELPGPFPEWKRGVCCPPSETHF